MNTQLVLQILGSAAFAALIATIVTGFFNRKKLGAEATKIITDAASGVVASIKEDNERLRGRETSLEKRVEELEKAQDDWDRERREWMRILRRHQAWDESAVDAVKKAIPPIFLPEPPPLIPANGQHRY